MQKPEFFAACQAADTVTTIVAMKGGAVEGNPLMAGVIKHAGYLGLIGVKIALVYAVFRWREHIAPEAIAVTSVATCGIAVHNLMRR